MGKRISLRPEPTWAVEQTAPNIHIIRFDQVRVGWEQWVLLSGDRHHDNVDTHWDLEEKHLKLAQERNALVVDVGDLFCAMQGKWDPRSNLDKLRPELKTANYLDKLVSEAAKFYGSYAPLFAVIGRGNHETNISNRHGVDLTANLVHRLRTDHKGQCFAGGYSGWVLFQFTIQKTSRMRRTLHYYHGTGGGGPVTRGVIQTNRMAVYVADADYVVSGHTHDQWIVPIKRVKPSHEGRQILQELTYHIRVPSYKDEYRDGSGGWAVERGHAPKPIGCVWLRLYYDGGDRIKEQITPDLE